MIKQSEPALYYYNSIPLTRIDIENALLKSGLARDDIVLIHSDVSAFGKLGDIKSRKLFLNEILKSFFNVIGNDGTLIVPTYSYSFCNNQEFDVKRTKSTVGVFSEHVRTLNLSVRSKDPIFSHAGIGKYANVLLNNIGSECFGKDSFFDRIFKLNGKIMNFGKFFDITFLHYIEKDYNVSYRFDKIFSGAIIDEHGNKHHKEFKFYVRVKENDRKVVYDMTRLGNELERRGLLNRASLGNSAILCSKIMDCYNVGIEMLKKNESAFQRVFN